MMTSQEEAVPAAPAATVAAAPADEKRSVKSVVLVAYGAFDKLKVQEWPLPARPGPNQVEVSVDTCGMNFADLYLRRGLMRDRQTPFVLGLECTGKVTAVGEDVSTLKVGDRVLCYQYSGDLYREIVILPADNCFILPEKISFEDGAALASNYLTAYFSLMDIGNLRPGQSVLIHSCSGGVGCAATQLAKSIPSVTIFGTTSAEKHEAAQKNGVTHVLHPENYEQELLKLSPEGVDIIIDNLSGPNFTTSQQLLKPLGRVIITGINSMMSGHQKLGVFELLKGMWSTKNVSASDLVMKNRVVAGLHLGLLMNKDLKRVRGAIDELFRLHQEGKIKPQIDSVWPLDKVVDATMLLAERKNIGKVLLKIDMPSIKLET